MAPAFDNHQIISCHLHFSVHSFKLSIMKSVKINLGILLALAFCAISGFAADEWISLFNGKNLQGWKVTKENPESISVQEGVIVIDGPRAHLYYTGDVKRHNFKDFEFRAKVKTMPHANSGIYFHTQYQEEGWPYHGYECQVNNTHSDPSKTGGLWGVNAYYKQAVQDKEWFDYYVRVQGKKVTIKINGVVTIEFEEPDHPEHAKKLPGRLIRSGTFALQAHDPKSKILYKEIYVRPLD